MKYLVIEIQKFEDGKVSTPTYAFDTQEKAEAKFYSIASSAVLSTLPVHAVKLCNEEGFDLKAAICYKHVPVEEVVEEPTEEPGEE